MCSLLPSRQSVLLALTTVSATTSDLSSSLQRKIRRFQRQPSLHRPYRRNPWLPPSSSSPHHNLLHHPHNSSQKDMHSHNAYSRLPPLPPPLSIYPMLSIPRPENSLPPFLTIPNPPNTGRPPTVPARRPIDPSSSSIPLATTTSPYVLRALDPSRKANCRSTVTATPYSPVTVTIAVLAS